MQGVWGLGPSMSWTQEGWELGPWSQTRGLGTGPCPNLSGVGSFGGWTKGFE
ncbi:hypothetical protein H0E87_031646, partial [Populus deltoides]